MAGPFKMKGSPMARNFGVGSPVRDGQATKGKLKKTFTGPIKPMTDKDGDGIPVGVDVKDTPGGKQSNPKPKKHWNEYNTPKKTEPVSNIKTDPRKRPYDDGRNKGTLKGNTKFKSDINHTFRGGGAERYKRNIKKNLKKIYNYFTEE
jgi:hypothetical protein